MFNILSLFRKKRKEPLEQKKPQKKMPTVTTPCDQNSQTIDDRDSNLKVSTLDEYGVPLELANDETYLEIKEILEEMLQTKEAVKTWLNSSGRGSSKTPIEYILEGKLGAARRIVAALEYGILS
jgi:hypothetical protein